MLLAAVFTKVLFLFEALLTALIVSYFCNICPLFALCEDVPTLFSSACFFPHSLACSLLCGIFLRIFPSLLPCLFPGQVDDFRQIGFKVHMINVTVLKIPTLKVLTAES
jgi:hypothetical protein